MFMSRLELDTAKRIVKSALLNPNIFHGALVSKAFPNINCTSHPNDLTADQTPGKQPNVQADKTSAGKNRILWRIDKLNNKIYLLIVSSEKPELTSLNEQFGYPDRPGEIKFYSPFLDSIQPGSKWYFKLVCSPSIADKANHPDRKRGKRRPILKEEEKITWLEKFSLSNGFKISRKSVRILKDEKISFTKSKGTEAQKRVTFHACTFQGVLEVTDTEKFRKALETGCGSEKAYGMGLLTIIKPPAANFCPSKNQPGKIK